MKKAYLFLLSLLVAVAANAADWYLVGNNLNGASSWDDNATYKFTPSADDANVLTYEIASLAGNFKVKEAGTWNTSFGTNGSALKEGVEYQAYKNAGDISVDGVIKNATVTINTATYKITVTGQSEVDTYDVVYLVGDFGSGWNESTQTYPLAAVEGEENTFSGTYALTAAKSYFKMRAGNSIFGTGGADIAVELDTPYVAKTSGNAYSIAAGEYTFTFKVVGSTGTLTVTGEGIDPTPVVHIPAALYLLGNVDGLAWSTTAGTPLAVASEGVFAIDEFVVDDAGEGFGYFSFAETLGADWDAVNGSYRYGPATADYEPAFTEGVANEALKAYVPNVDASSCNSFKVAAGKYAATVAFDAEGNASVALTAKGGDDPTPVQPLDVTFNFASLEDMSAYLGKAVAEADFEADGTTGNYLYLLDGAIMVSDNVVLLSEKTEGVAAGTKVTGMRLYKQGGFSDTSKALHARDYKNNTITLSAPQGYAFTNVSFAGTKVTSGITLAEADAELGTLAEADGANVFTAADGKTVKGIHFNITATINVSSIDVVLHKIQGGGDPEFFIPEALYLMGNVNGSDWATAAGAALEGDGGEFFIDEFTVDDAGEGFGYFSFAEKTGADWDAVNGGYRFGPETADYTPDMSEGYCMEPLTFYIPDVNASACNSFKVAAGKYSVEVYFSEDGAEMALTYLGGGDDPVVYVPDALYILGHVDGYEWSTSRGVELTRADNVFTSPKFTVNDAGEGYGYISFAEAVGADWDAVNSANRYGAATADQTIDFADGIGETDLTLYEVNVDASACNSFKIEAGSYTAVVVFTENAPVLTLTKSSDGIDGIEAAEAGEARWYNLQGVEVARPEAGVYICVKGGKASKVIVK